ncbi:MAG: hypothetical protein ABSA11_09830 [Candidatus Bathyarchaeia archaeon]|jgi:hypothetical protein
MGEENKVKDSHGSTPLAVESKKDERLAFLKVLASGITPYHALRITLNGHVHIGDFKMHGWKAAVPFYAFRCEKHGIVVNYPAGHMEKLLCPFCLDEE